MANNTNGTSLPSSGNYSCSEIAKTTLWPGAPCSGRGKCTPTGCVCPPDWSGNSDFFTSAGYDCQIHDIATTVLNSFTAVVSTFNLIYGFYLLWHHFASAPSSDLRGRSTKGINRAKKREKARFNKLLCFVIFLLNSFAWLAYSLLKIVLGLRIGESLVVTVLFCLGAFLFWIAVIWFCWTWSNLLQSMSKFLGKGFDDKLLQLKYSLQLSVGMNLIQASMPLGCYFSTDRDMKIAFTSCHYLFSAVMIANTGYAGYWVLAQACEKIKTSTDPKMVDMLKKLEPIRNEALSQTVQQSLVAVVFGFWPFLLSVATYQLPIAWGSGLFLQTLVMFFLDTNKSARKVTDASSRTTSVQSEDASSASVVSSSEQEEV